MLAINVGYFTLFEVFGGGRTLGKRATGLRVVTDGGGQVGLRASLIRNIIRLVETSLAYLPAIVSVLATCNNQRLGDLAAGTLVVRDTKLEPVVAPPRRPRSARSATRTGTSPASARRRPARSVPSSSAATSSARARAAHWRSSWPGACARWSPAHSAASATRPSWSTSRRPRRGDG